MYCWVFFYYSLFFFIIRCVQHLRLTPSSSLLLYIITITVVERSFYGSRQNSNALICVSLMPTLIQVFLHITLNVEEHIISHPDVCWSFEMGTTLWYLIFFLQIGFFIFTAYCPIVLFCDRDDEDDAPLRILDRQWKMLHILYIHISNLHAEFHICDSNFFHCMYIIWDLEHQKCVYDRDHVLLLILLRTIWW